MPDDVDELADVTPEEFVTARNELAKRLKAEGDPARASEVKRLRKPTVTEWITGQVRRHHDDVVGQLRSAVGDMAEAQEAAITSGQRQALGDATTQRRDALKALGGAVDHVLAHHGRPAHYRDEVMGSIESDLTAEVVPNATFGWAENVDLPEPLSKPASRPPQDTRSQRERMLAGDLYIADEPEIVEESRRARRLIEAYNRSPADDDVERRRILDELLGAFGTDSVIRPPLYCDLGYQLHVGARTFVNFGLVALDVAPIVIGDDVQIGPNVQLLTPTHPVEAEPRRAKWESARPITVSDNVWLGGGAIVLPGVHIGENTVVGAGSVVTKDLPADVVAVGNPARILRSV